MTEYIEKSNSERSLDEPSEKIERFVPEFEYDADNVPKISVEDISRIEEAGYRLFESGASEEEVQQQANRMLSELGVDASDGFAVVTVVGLDGKEITRAINTDWDDFGTTIRSRLVPKTKEVSQTDVDESEKTQDDKSKELLVEGLRNDIHELSAKLKVAGILEARKAQILTLVDSLMQISKALSYGDVSSWNERYAQAVAQINQANQTINEAVEASAYDRNIIVDINAKTEEAIAIEGSSKESNPSGLKTTLEQLHQDIVSATNNTIAVDASVLRAQDNLSSIRRIISELEYARTGREMYSTQLMNRARELEDAIQRADATSNATKSNLTSA